MWLKVSCLCVAVLVRPADCPANAGQGQHLFIRIHRGVSKQLVARDQQALENQASNDEDPQGLLGRYQGFVGGEWSRPSLQSSQGGVLQVY